MAAGLGMGLSGVPVGHRPQLRTEAVWAIPRVGRGSLAQPLQEGKVLPGSAVWNLGVTPLLLRLQISQPRQPQRIRRPPRNRCGIRLISCDHRLRRSIYR